MPETNRGHQAKRLLDILLILNRSRYVTVKNLSESYGVSRKTIYRDIDILTAVGAPIWYERVGYSVFVRVDRDWFMRIINHEPLMREERCPRLAEIAE